MGEQERAAADRAVDDLEASVVDSRRVPDAERRRVLIAVGGSGAVFLAGCLNEDDAATYEVVFVDGDETFDVDVEEDEELLYPALDAGVDIPYTCEAGTRGQCTAKYDGNADEVVTHEGNEYLDDDQIADGWVLTCVAYARADSELEVAHPDDA
ncbi:2Fe-2S iron-sulfur cluster-binding protein [Natrarchaeobius oligotrophus]|uniref:(2Fe-2S)-binding protein n=1 Tax=Natrarchaeobius chitinivorans TaxID=1679083 RepID=A0A3N6MPR6_NATCH|nr:2Fe-2S iron-sulfur cluster-binding protein [Natrarchaeobius chitinivorans]RQG99590.1 (2Fe-2S)-binding protein [Natrarchaeobius chitinivorans]